MGDVVTRIQIAFQERKRVTNVMDFDDLLVLWLRLLIENDDVRELYQRRFQFVLDGFVKRLQDVLARFR